MMAGYEKVLRNKQEKIKRDIKNCSGLLVWSGDPGILIIAPNKSNHASRIHKVHDRIACVTRGLNFASENLWKPAVNLADKRAFELSPGDVYAKDCAQETAEKLLESWNNPVSRSLPAEAVFVQLSRKVSGDYMAYVDMEGNVQEFENYKFIDSYDDEKEDRDEDDNTGGHIQKPLSFYDPALLPGQIISLLRGYISCPGSDINHVGQVLFGNQAKRVEIALLDRDMVIRGQFNKVYKRL